MTNDERVFALPPAVYGADMVGMGREHYELLTASLRECVTILSRLVDLKADESFTSTYPDPYGAINDARSLLGLPRLAPDSPEDIKAAPVRAGRTWQSNELLVYSGWLRLENGVEMLGGWVRYDDVRTLVSALKHARGCGLLSPEPASLKRIDDALTALTVSTESQP